MSFALLKRATEGEWESRFRPAPKPERRNWAAGQTPPAILESPCAYPLLSGRVLAVVVLFNSLEVPAFPLVK